MQHRFNPGNMCYYDRTMQIMTTRDIFALNGVAHQWRSDLPVRMEYFKPQDERKRRAAPRRLPRETKTKRARDRPPQAVIGFSLCSKSRRSNSPKNVSPGTYAGPKKKEKKGKNKRTKKKDKKKTRPAPSQSSFVDWQTLP